jgi:hypothetical protein
MEMKRILCVIIGMLLMVGCAPLNGSMSYTPPEELVKYPTTVVISKSREAVWKEAIPALSKSFFVVNNIDKSSGFINVSYSGEPENYVDCGYTDWSVENPNTKESRSGRAGNESNTTLFRIHNRMLVKQDRKSSLEGRANLTFEEIDKNNTRFTVTVKYVFTRSGMLSTQQMDSNYRWHTLTQPYTNTITFNSNTAGSFQYVAGAPTVWCKPTGKMELNILEIIQNIK